MIDILTRNRVLVAMRDAPRVLPGPVGQVIARELGAWVDARGRFGGKDLVVRLLEDIERRVVKAEEIEMTEREMVTLVDPDGQEFSTGDLGTVNSLLVNGYRLKEGTTQQDVAETLAAPDTSPAAEAARPAGGQSQASAGQQGGGGEAAPSSKGAK